MVTCRVAPDNVNGVWVAAFTGDLTPLTMLNVRAAVLKCLVECPAAIVVDLHGCSGDPQLSLAMLPTLARQAGDRGVRVLYTASGGLAARIRRHAMHRFLELYPTRAEAQEAAMSPGAHRWLRLEDLEPGPEAVADMRAIVDCLCQAWGLGHLTRRAEAIMSDMVSPTYRPTGTHVDVTMTLLGDLLHLRARDRPPAQPPHRRTTAADPPDPRDRPEPGLRQIARQASCWGMVPSSDGRLVWATLCIDRTKATSVQPAATVRDIKSARTTDHQRSGHGTR